MALNSSYSPFEEKTIETPSLETKNPSTDFSVSPQEWPNRPTQNLSRHPELTPLVQGMTQKVTDILAKSARSLTP